MDAAGSLSVWDDAHRGGDNLCGCVWLPSYIARLRAGHDEPDARDESLLAFLAMDAKQIERFVREHHEDEDAARAILLASERSPEETVRWSSTFVARHRKGD
ncbi:MAG: hypothetical protein M3Y18_00610 [Candidatus Eremiobacteraeota bacterium]|nr:hypothetical protein [Candidatus Eremiobacteraeota bacterium]